MRVLAVQFLGPKAHRLRFDPDLAVTLAVLKRLGHDVDLLWLSGFDETLIRSRIARCRAEVVVLDLCPLLVDLARRLSGYIRRVHALPVIGLGTYATIRPDEALSLPGMEAIVIGQAEASLPALLQNLRSSDEQAMRISGVWFNVEEGVVKNDLSLPCENLDALPFAERDLFGYQDHIDRCGQAEIKVGRGCPYRCGYCNNELIMDMHAGMGEYVRRRSPQNVLEEIELLLQRYRRISRFEFLDHAFALDVDWLSVFADEYKRDIGLPYCCHVRANAVDERLVRLLCDSGCREVRIDLISGSDFIRNEIFNMNTTDEQLIRAFGLFRQAGIRTEAMCFVGSPYESQITVEQTIALARRVRPDRIDCRVYYPFVGTRAAEICAENGWISGRGERSFFRNDTVLEMPSLRREQINELARRLPAAVKRRRGGLLGRLLRRLAAPRPDNAAGIGRKGRRGFTARRSNG